MRMKTGKQTKTADGAARGRVVLVGTYRGDQLKDWPGWYCWPLDKDCRGAGGLSIGLERAGIHVVIANEIMPDFAATLAANHPDTNVINEDIHRFKEAA